MIREDKRWSLSGANVELFVVQTEGLKYLHVSELKINFSLPHTLQVQTMFTEDYFIYTCHPHQPLKKGKKKKRKEENSP